jgi:hypothetical protein
MQNPYQRAHAKGMPEPTGTRLAIARNVPMGPGRKSGKARIDFGSRIRQGYATENGTLPSPHPATLSRRPDSARLNRCPGKALRCPVDARSSRSPTCAYPRTEIAAPGGADTVELERGVGVGGGRCPPSLRDGGAEGAWRPAGAAMGWREGCRPSGSAFAAPGGAEAAWRGTPWKGLGRKGEAPWGEAGGFGGARPGVGKTGRGVRRFSLPHLVVSSPCGRLSRHGHGVDGH